MFNNIDLTRICSYFPNKVDILLKDIDDICISDRVKYMRYIDTIIKLNGCDIKYFRNNKSLYFTECYCFITNDTIIFGFYSNQSCKYCFKTETILWNTKILKKYYDISQDFSPFINKILDNTNIKNIIFTGHRFGGSIATITCGLLNLEYTDKFNISCITFGATKCGNYEFYSYMNKNFKKYLSFYTKKDKYVKYPLLYFQNINGLKLYDCMVLNNYNSEDYGILVNQKNTIDYHIQRI